MNPATLRGNRGHGLTVGLLDPHAFREHGGMMHGVFTRTVPDATVIRSDDVSPTGLGALTNRGCSVVCMPFTLAHPWFDDWDEVIRACVGNGVLLFASAGNGVSAARFPARHPLVFSCGVTPLDKVEVLLPDLPSTSLACAHAAAVAVQWLGHGQFLYSTPASRNPAFRHWLSLIPFSGDTL